jgi:hypothetical protein
MLAWSLARGSTYICRGSGLLACWEGGAGHGVGHSSAALGAPYHIVLLDLVLFDSHWVVMLRFHRPPTSMLYMRAMMLFFMASVVYRESMMLDMRECDDL